MKRILWILIIITLLFLSFGCSSRIEMRTNNNIGYQVVDDEGNIVTMKQKPQRILTTQFHLDNLVLGVVPQDRVVAISSVMDDEHVSYAVPGEFTKPKRFKMLSLEGILGLQPDLIITRSNIGREKIQTYREMGIPVFISNLPIDARDMEEKIRKIAAITGEKEHGEILIKKINDEVNLVTRSIPAHLANVKSCILVLKMNPNYGGKNSFFDQQCRIVKVKNAASELGVINGQPISKEIIIKANPDFILLSKNWEIKHGKADTYFNEFKSDPAYRDLHAVKEGHVLYLKDKYLASVVNQNYIWAVRRLSNAIYGDIFPVKEEKFLKGY